MGLFTQEAAMAAIQRYYRAVRKIVARVISPFLFIGGVASVTVGVAIAIEATLMLGLFLVFCGLAGIAIAHIIDLLKEIESSLAAIRVRVDSGVLALLPDLMKVGR
jgi:hypothetical protein